MCWIVFAFLYLLWVIGFAFNVAGRGIHVLLVAGVILVLVDIVKAESHSSRQCPELPDFNAGDSELSR